MKTSRIKILINKIPTIREIHVSELMALSLTMSKNVKYNNFKPNEQNPYHIRPLIFLYSSKFSDLLGALGGATGGRVRCVDIDIFGICKSILMSKS